MSNLQRTLNSIIAFSGVALHSGIQVSVEIRPAPANTGIVFQRTDMPGMPYIKAEANSVFDTSLATRIGSADCYVSTIEHLMAAFFGFGIDNAIVALNNCEMPILDGSAAPFLVLLDEAGIQELAAPRKIIVIRQDIEIVDERNPSRFIRIEPAKKPMISYAIDFANSATISKQNVQMHYNAFTFCEEFAYARTFCLKEEIDYLRSKGLAKGGSLQNALVVSQTEGVLNAHGLRNELEFVKHKVLDCIGDLYLLGAPILGHVIAHKAGHDLHTKLAKAIYANLQASEILIPSAKDADMLHLKDLLTYPTSLIKVQKNLANLPIG